MTYRTAALGFGAFLTVLAFISLLVAIVTNYWVIIQVDRDTVGLSTEGSNLAAYSRRRGLFKECFSDSSAWTHVRGNLFADASKRCLENELMLNRLVTYSPLYRTRADLQIAMIVFLCFALLFCVCGFGVFCYSVSMTAPALSKKWSLTTKWSGILLFIAAFCNALGMAFFHGAEFMETQRIGVDTNDDAPYPFYFTQAQPNALQNATSRRYSWSYALSWLAVFFEVLAAICLFLCGACCMPRRNEKQFLEVGTINSTRSYGQRNLAYEYMEGKQPVAIYEAQPPHMISDGAYHDHFQGRHFDPYNRGSMNRPVRPQYNYDEGGWNWQ